MAWLLVMLKTRDVGLGRRARGRGRHAPDFLVMLLLIAAVLGMATAFATGV